MLRYKASIIFIKSIELINNLMNLTALDILLVCYTF